MCNFLIDTHCHLHDPEFFTPEQQSVFLVSAASHNVQQIICIGTNPADSETAAAFSQNHENVFWTYGIHPEFANDYDVRELTKDDLFGSDILDRFASGDQGGKLADDKLFEEWSLTPRADVCQNHGPRRGFDFDDVTLTKKVYHQPESCPVTIDEGGLASGSRENNACLGGGHLVAIGEIGLDYHYPGYSRSAQIHLFESLLQLARDLHLPVSLHIREAFTDAFAVLDNFPELSGVIHSFTGSKKDLKAALARNFFIGVNGLLTYTTPPLPPLDCILLETDAPFLTPVPFRGTINKPEYIAVIARCLSEKLGVAESLVMEQTTQNARKIFQL